MKETGGKEVDRASALWKSLRNVELLKYDRNVWETVQSVPPQQQQGAMRSVVEQPRDAKDNVLTSPVGSALKTPSHTGHGTPEKVETGTKPFGEGVQPKITGNTAHDGNEKAAVTNVFTTSYKGLGNVVEEEPTRQGRWFARYDDKGRETFSARVDPKTNKAEISWTEEVLQLADNLAEIQTATGQNIPEINGMASDGIQEAIEAKRFNSDLYEKHLSRRLGGQWKIEVIRRPGPRDVWDINAKRIGD
jgi:hypothetical protein